MSARTLYESLIEQNASFEAIFEALASERLCPVLLNDDFGHWAVSFEGYQSIPEHPGEPDDINTSFFVLKEHWKKTINEALKDAIYRD